MKQTTIGKIRDRNPMLKYLLKSQIVSFELTDLMLVQPSDSAWIMPDEELYKTSFNKGSTNWKVCWKCVSEVCPSSSRRFLDPFTISVVTILFVSELKVKNRGSQSLSEFMSQIRTLNHWFDSLVWILGLRINGPSKGMWTDPLIPASSLILFSVSISRIFFLNRNLLNLVKMYQIQSQFQIRLCFQLKKFSSCKDKILA